MRLAEIDPTLREDADDLGGSLRSRDLPDLTLGECLRLVSIHNTPRRSREQTLFAAAVARQEKLGKVLDDARERLDAYLKQHPLNDGLPDYGYPSWGKVEAFLQWLLATRERARWDALNATDRFYIDARRSVAYDKFAAVAHDADLRRWMDDYVVLRARYEAARTAREETSATTVRKRFDAVLRRDLPLLKLLRVGMALHALGKVDAPEDEDEDDEGYRGRPTLREIAESVLHGLLSDDVDWAVRLFLDHGFRSDELRGTVVQMINAATRRQGFGDPIWLRGFRLAVERFGEDTTLHALVEAQLGDTAFRRAGPPRLSPRPRRTR